MTKRELSPIYVRDWNWTKNTEVSNETGRDDRNAKIIMKNEHYLEVIYMLDHRIQQLENILKRLPQENRATTKARLMEARYIRETLRDSVAGLENRV
jgi:hypothetical protein